LPPADLPFRIAAVSSLRHPAAVETCAVAMMTLLELNFVMLAVAEAATTDLGAS